MRSGTTLVLAVVSAVLCLGVGCGEREPKLSAKAAEGKAAFKLRGCPNCHQVFGRGKRKGPPLTGPNVRSRDRQWYLDFLTNPRSRVPGAKMPRPLITPTEKERITDYLLEIR
ncbi:MAG: c-type cytochrome [Terriglobia bacterium]